MKAKRALIMLIAVSAYFFGSLINSLWAAEETKAQQAEAGADTVPQGVLQRSKEEFETKGLKDPFRDYFDQGVSEHNGGPEAVKEPEVVPPTLVVQGVICGGRFNQAIINNKVIKVGDTIEEALITSIDKDGVTVFFSNKSFKLTSPAVNTMQALEEQKLEGGNDEK